MLIRSAGGEFVRIETVSGVPLSIPMSRVEAEQMLVTLRELRSVVEAELLR